MRDIPGRPHLLTQGHLGVVFRRDGFAWAAPGPGPRVDRPPQ